MTKDQEQEFQDLKPKKNKPPKLARKLLDSFLRDDLAEEVHGDLDEKFYSLLKNKSPYRAQLNYWYQVIHYLRPFAIRKSKTTNLNHYDMFQNYFKIAFRNLNRNKGYSFINIGGLAIGMAVAMLIGLWMYDELSFDKYHENYDRLAQVMQNQTFNGTKGTQNSIPRPLEFALRNTYGSDFQYLSMATWTGDHILTFGGTKDLESRKLFSGRLSGNDFLKDAQGQPERTPRSHLDLVIRIHCSGTLWYSRADQSIDSN